MSGGDTASKDSVSKTARTIDAPRPPERVVPDEAEDPAVLPIERVTMPADDVSDLRDVVDAINRLCRTMKTSDSDEPDPDPALEKTHLGGGVTDAELVNPEEVVVSEVETYVAELWSDATSAWVESVEAIREPSPIQAEVETVGCNPPPKVVQDVDTVASSRVDDEPAESSYASTEVESVQAVSPNRLPTPSEIVESVALDASATRSKNIETAPSNLSLNVDVARNVPDQTLKVDSVKTAPKYQSSPQIERVEPIVSDRSPMRPEDIRTVVSDPDLLTMSCEPASEMYYTASSEVSLLSDFEMPDRVPPESLDGRETLTSGVMAGHVAAMRERFESMTRTNTPCPDLMRSISPSLDVCRNITPSPDQLG